MFQTNIVPGQGFVLLKVYEEKPTISSKGRAKPGGYEPTEKEFFGMVTSASQSEREQWKQRGHAITHKIIKYGSAGNAKPTDVLREVNGKAEYYIQGMKNPAGLNVTHIYYVEERLDIKRDLEG